MSTSNSHHATWCDEGIALEIQASPQANWRQNLAKDIQGLL